MADLRHPFANVLGNFLISFFTPLAGSTFAQSIFTNTVNFSQSLIVALISAGVATGLSLGYELKKYGKKRR